MKFLWPPRPTKAIASGMIPNFEGRGWWGQIKKNGTCSVIMVEDGKVVFRTRRNEPHKAWTPTQDTIAEFQQYNGCTFVGELLHSKHASVKNTFYLFDILRFDGELLTGQTMEDRHALLSSMFTDNDARIYVAENFKSKLRELFDSLTDPLDEGLVLKNPESRLKLPYKPDANAGWQVKVRKSHKNYGF